MSKPSGGPAFPVHPGSNQYGQNGMDLRQYFAAHAPITLADVDQDGFATLGDRIDELANLRWQYADAMLGAQYR